MKTKLTILIAIIILAPSMVMAQYQDERYEQFIQSIHNMPDKRAENIVNLVNKKSDKYDVPEDIIFAIMWQESSFSNRRSEVDIAPCSAGYMQLLRTTASKLENRKISCKELVVNWRLNIDLGSRYIRELWDVTGHLAGAIGRYNGTNNLDYVYQVLEKVRSIRSYKGSRRKY